MSAATVYTPFLQELPKLNFEEKVQFFIKNITAEYLDDAKKICADALAWLDHRTPSPKIEGATLLQVTDDRKLMTLALIYIEQVTKSKEASFRQKFQTMGMQAIAGWEETAKEIRKEQDTFCHSLKGFKVIETCNPRKREDCFFYIFKNAPWFHKYLPPGETIEEVVQFLDTKGYKKAGKDKAIGQIAIYIREGKPQHYGKVVCVEGENLTLWSKFGNQDVYEHPLELVPYDYGTEVIFLTPPLIDI